MTPLRGGAGRSLPGRVRAAYAALPRERRPAVLASTGLFLTLFLPWYQRQYFALLGGRLQPASDVQSAWQAFSFVEAAVLVIALGVLVLLFQRAEGRDFHVPGSDGGVILAAGCWVCLLVVWRIFDKQGATSHAQFATSYGIEWGIFLALADAAFLAWTGARIRAGERTHRSPVRVPASRPRRERERPRQTATEWAAVDWGAPPAAGAATAAGAGASPAATRPTRVLPDARPAPAAPPSSAASPVAGLSEPPEMPRPRRPRRPVWGAPEQDTNEAPTRPLGATGEPAPAPCKEEQLTIPFEERRPEA